MTRSVLRIVVCGLLATSVAAPAAAQVDLTGMWAPIFHEDQVERIPGPDVGDYAGLPINDALRLRADTWDASLLTLPEHQCKPHPSTYGFRGVGNLRVTADVAHVFALRFYNRSETGVDRTHEIERALHRTSQVER